MKIGYDPCPNCGSEVESYSFDVPPEMPFTGTAAQIADALKEFPPGTRFTLTERVTIPEAS